MPRYAAVDVGSNSVRMMAAEVAAGGKTQILAEDRHVTRLGASVFKEGRIAPEAIQFVCGELARMAQVFRKLEVTAVRAVATSAVRDASNQEQFLQQASAALNAPIEVISGQEEARLIHLGVQARWPQQDRRTLIVDEGGGSAEVILSENGSLAVAFSKPLGAVRLTEVFLEHDPPLELELQRMEKYIDEKLSSAVNRIGLQPFARAIGTSATAAALVCSVNRIPRARREEADRLRATTPQIRDLFEALTARDRAGRSKILGIGPRRAELIVAGAAVFLRVLQLFRYGSLHYSVAGVRDGIISDLAARGVGRELSQLSRDQRRTVEQMARRYGVQPDHVRKVAALGQTLFEALRPLHKLAPAYGKLLEASAYLHDIGHFVSDVGHHKHSAYLVANSDMPGFTDAERRFISALCRYHRKALPIVRHSTYTALQAEERKALVLLTPLLRLADSLDRGHSQQVAGLHIELKNGGVVLGVESKAPVDLELWAATRIGDAFREVYQRSLVLARTSA